jgi:hypothetical protein
MRCQCPDRREGNPAHEPHECTGVATWRQYRDTHNPYDYIVVCVDCTVTGYRQTRIVPEED